MPDNLAAILLNLVNSVSHELSIVPSTLDPVKGYCGVEPTVDCNLIGAERLLYVDSKIHCHVSGNQFQPGDGQVAFRDAGLCADESLCSFLSLLDNRIDSGADTVGICISESMQCDF